MDKMIITKIIGNISSVSPDKNQMVEKVNLTNDQLLKRVQRVVTDQGHEIGIRLTGFTEIKEGDILFKNARVMIIVDVLPQKVIVIKPRTMKEMGTVAHQIGNRHLPAQFDDDVMIVQEDDVTQQLLEHLKIPFELQTKKMSKPFRYIGHHRHD